MTSGGINIRAATLYRNDGMDAHAAVEGYVGHCRREWPQSAAEHFADGMALAFRLFAANPEAIGPLALAIKAEDIRDPLLPSDPQEWESTFQREAWRLLEFWERGDEP